MKHAASRLLQLIGFADFSRCRPLIDSNSNPVTGFRLLRTNPPSCELPLGVGGGVPGSFTLPQAPTSYIVDRLEHSPATIQFFFISQKLNLGIVHNKKFFLQWSSTILFLKMKKVIFFLAFQGDFCVALVGWSTERFSKSNFRECSSFFDFPPNFLHLAPIK